MTVARPDIREAIAGATRLVASWPAWKRGILTRSAEPTVAAPRPFVDNRGEKTE